MARICSSPAHRAAPVRARLVLLVCALVLFAPQPMAAASAGQKADVAVRLAGPPEPVIVGDTVTFTATVTNYGPAEATNVELVGDMNIPMSGFLTHEGTCKLTSFNRFWCPLGRIAVGEEVVVSYVSTDLVPGGRLMTLRSSVTVSADEEDLVRNNNAIATTGMRSRVADLSIRQLVDDQDPVVTGDVVEYTAVVTNVGPDRALDVRVSGTANRDVLSVHAFGSAPCVRSGSSFTCDFVLLDPSEEITVTYTVAASSAWTTIQTGVSVTSYADDQKPQDNTAVETTTVRDRAVDLSIAVGDSADPVAVGAPVTYTATVRNLGPDEAHGIRVRGDVDHLAPFEPGSPCHETPGSEAAFVCDIYVLAAGQMATVTFVAVAADPWTLRAWVAVDADEADAFPSDNQETESTEVWPGLADLAVTLTDVDPVLVGGEAVYTATVTNLGPDPAFDVHFLGLLSDNVTGGMSGIASSHGECVYGGLESHCRLGTLASGESATVEFWAPAPEAPTTITATARVEAGHTDDPVHNNEASEDTSVEAAPPGGGLPSIEVLISPRGWRRRRPGMPEGPPTFRTTRRTSGAPVTRGCKERPTGSSSTGSRCPTPSNQAPVT